LKTTASDLCSAEIATLQVALEHGTLAQAQHSFSHHKTQRAYEALLRTADGFSPPTRMLVLSRLRIVDRSQLDGDYVVVGHSFSDSVALALL
jgi:hypothetical protein